MTSRERVIRALNFEEVDRVPIECDDVANPWWVPGHGAREHYIQLEPGFINTDAWGCVWHAAEDGVCGEVKESPLAGEDWSALSNYQPPWDVIESADLSKVNQSCAELDKFMMPAWNGLPEPFQRMQFLRGTEQLFIDLALDEPEVYQLRDMVHEYYLRMLGLFMETDVDGVHIQDDWGSQNSLLISPEKWRAFYKPLYRDYCELAHAHGKYVVMHSDGFTREIIPDLIEIGVNAVNLQLFCMDIEEIAGEFRGKICFWGEIDRQYLLTQGTTEEVRAAVHRVAHAFMPTRKTGVVGQWHGGKGHRPENEAAAYEAWKAY